MDQAQVDQLAVRLAELAFSLDFKEREILRLRLGDGDAEPYTAAECGRIWKRNASWARQVEHRALAKFREAVVLVLTAAGQPVPAQPDAPPVRPSCRSHRRRRRRSVT